MEAVVLDQWEIKYGVCCENSDNVGGHELNSLMKFNVAMCMLRYGDS